MAPLSRRTRRVGEEGIKNNYMILINPLSCARKLHIVQSDIGGRIIEGPLLLTWINFNHGMDK